MATTTRILTPVDRYKRMNLNDRSNGCIPGYVIAPYPSLTDCDPAVQVLQRNERYSTIRYQCVPFVKSATMPLEHDKLRSGSSFINAHPLHFDAHASKFITGDVTTDTPPVKLSDFHFLFVGCEYASGCCPTQPKPAPLICIDESSNTIYLTDRDHSCIIETFEKRRIRMVDLNVTFHAIDGKPQLTLEMLRTIGDQPALIADYSLGMHQLTALYTNAPYIELRNAENELTEVEARRDDESSAKRQKTSTIDRLTKKCEKLRARKKLFDEIDMTAINTCSILRVQVLPADESARNMRMLLARNAFLKFKESANINSMDNAYSAMKDALAQYADV